jgi:hypothetical protein
MRVSFGRERAIPRCSEDVFTVLRYAVESEDASARVRKRYNIYIDRVKSEVEQVTRRGRLPADFIQSHQNQSIYNNINRGARR